MHTKKSSNAFLRKVINRNRRFTDIWIINRCVMLRIIPQCPTPENVPCVILLLGVDGLVALMKINNEVFLVIAWQGNITKNACNTHNER